MNRERQDGLVRRYEAIVNDEAGVFRRLSDTYQREINGVLTRLRGAQLTDQQLTAQDCDLQVHEQYIPQQLAKEQAALVRRYEAIVNGGAGVFRRLSDAYQREINGVLTRLRGAQLTDQQLTSQDRDLQAHEQYIPQQLAKEQVALARRYEAIVNGGAGVFRRLSDAYQREINGVLTRLRGAQLTDQQLTAQERDLPVHEQYISQQLVRERQAALERRYAQIVNNGIFLRLPDISQKEINGVLTRLRGSQLSDQELTAQDRDLQVHEQYIPQQLAREKRGLETKEWEVAEALFQQKRLEQKEDRGFKIRRKDYQGFTHSFMYIGGKLLRLEATHGNVEEYAGVGRQGRVKVVTDRSGKKYALKVEGSVDSRRDSYGEARKKAQDVEEKAGFRLGTLTRIRQKKTFDKIFSGKLHEPYYIKDKYYTLMPYVPGKNIDEYLEENRSLGAMDKRAIVLASMLSVLRVHQKGIIHADVKEDNFMIDVNPQNQISVRTIDFSNSLMLPQGETTVLSRQIRYRPSYRAPEAENRHTRFGMYSYKTDVYALGAMIRAKFGITTPAIEKMQRRELRDRATLTASILDFLNEMSKKDQQEVLLRITSEQRNELLMLATKEGQRDVVKALSDIRDHSGKPSWIGEHGREKKVDLRR